jgi:ATP-dependent Clp protease adaptor protein ClpS
MFSKLQANFPEIDVQEEVAFAEKTADSHDLIVYNDDVNSFDHVIESLIKVCKHEIEQAEQCTWIIHFNGKCQVKKGDFEKLASMCTALHERGISAQVE